MNSILLTPDMITRISLNALRSSLSFFKDYISAQAETIELAPKAPWVHTGYDVFSDSWFTLTPAETAMIDMLVEAKAELVARREALRAA